MKQFLFVTNNYEFSICRKVIFLNLWQWSEDTKLQILNLLKNYLYFINIWEQFILNFWYLLSLPSIEFIELKYIYYIIV